MTRAQLLEWGYTQSALSGILKVWNEVIKDDWRIIKIGNRDCLIISSEKYNELKNNKHGLTKNLMKYKNKFGTFFHYRDLYILTQEMINSAIEVEKQNRLEHERKEKLHQTQMETLLDQYKKEYGDKWKSYQWIVNNIGEYYTYDKKIEYFWTLIGDEWHKANWKGDIIISNNAVNRIKSAGLGTFLSRKFKVNGYSHEIIDFYDSDNAIIKVVEEVNIKYLYGICIGPELVYIGKTNNIKRRISEHKDCMEHPENYDNWQQDGLYAAMRENIGNISFILLYSGDVSELVIETKEKEAITTLRPKFNKQGNSMIYKFEEDVLKDISTEDLLKEIAKRCSK